MDGLDRKVLVVDRVLAARARGYVVIQGKTLPDGRSQYPNGQTSGRRDQVVRVNEC